MTLYQIAEATGTPRVADLRDELTQSELCEWGVYLNSPFSQRGRESMMNGWLVHVVRSIMSDKRHRPKFSDSMFPFDKIAKEFFVVPKPAQPVKGPAVKAGRVTTIGEAAHLAQVTAKAYEKALEDYRAGRIPNRSGLYIHEKLRK